MLPSKLESILPMVLLAAVSVGAGPVQSRSETVAEGDPAPRLTQVAELGLAEFQELRALLDLKTQPWATIPWKYSITEARRLAAATNKPIFMVVNTGNSLGCT
jgi:hypothetical protein